MQAQKDFTVRGLIVRAVDVGEADRILTVLTGEYGKLSVYARGVRSIRSHRLSSVQLYCYSEFTISRRGDSCQLRETALIEDFYALREDIVRLSLAGYIAETVSILTVEGEDQSEILRLTLNTLYLLASGTKDTILIKGGFELRLACLLGFMPDLSGCSVCSGGSDFLLIPGDGSLICSDCLMKLTEKGSPQSLPTAIPLPEPVLRAMRYVIGAPSRRVYSFELPEQEAELFGQVCEKYFLFHAERGFDTLDFYKLMAK